MQLFYYRKQMEWYASGNSWKSLSQTLALKVSETPELSGIALKQRCQYHRQSMGTDTAATWLSEFHNSTRSFQNSWGSYKDWMWVSLKRNWNSSFQDIQMKPPPTNTQDREVHHKTKQVKEDGKRNILQHIHHCFQKENRVWSSPSHCFKWKQLWIG